jgi:hypothetical protein
MAIRDLCGSEKLCPCLGPEFLSRRFAGKSYDNPLDDAMLFPALCVAPAVFFVRFFLLLSCLPSAA